MARGKIFCVLLLTVTCAVLIAYSNHFHNSFHFDDSHTIQNNLYIRNLQNIPSFFLDGSTFSSLPANQSYRPLLTTLNAIEYWLGHGDPFYFHLFSFLLYLLLCGVYLYVLNKIFDIAHPSKYNPHISLIAVGFYSVHTVHAETINYISARSDSLSTLFVVASLAMYIGFKRYRSTCVYLLPVLLGMLVKPTIAVFPILLLFYVLLFEEGISLPDLYKRSSFQALKRTIAKTVPSWCVCTGMLWFSSRMTPETFTPSNISSHEYALTQPYALLHYFISFFIPANLSADIEFERMQGLFDDRVVIGLAFIVILIIVAHITSRKMTHRPIAYGILWFFISSIPTSSGIIPLSESMNDHRMFFPFVGLMMSVSWAVRVFYLGKINWSSTLRWSISLALVLVFVGHVVGTYHRNTVWKDEESLWLDVTIKRPQNGRGLMNYGLTKMAKGDYKTAKAYFEKALVFNPSYSILHVNLGILNAAMGNIEAANSCFSKALALNSSAPSSYYYYARFLDKHGRIDEAEALLKKCISVSAPHVEARHLLMDIYAKSSMNEELEELASETLKLSPTDSKAIKYANYTSRNSSASTSKACSRNNLLVEELINIGLSCYRKGMYESSVKALEEAIKICSDSAAAHNNICAAYNELGQWEKAISSCKRALELDPGLHIAENNLRHALNRLPK